MTPFETFFMYIAEWFEKFDLAGFGEVFANLGRRLIETFAGWFGND